VRSRGDCSAKLSFAWSSDARKRPFAQMGKSIGRRAKGKNGERPKGYAHGGAAGGSSGTSGGAKKPRKLDGWAAARRQAAAVPRSALQSVVTAAPRYAKFDASQRQGASDARAARMAARRGLPDDADALAEGMRTPPQQRAGASRAADADGSPEPMSTHSPQLAGAVSPQPAGAASPQDAEMASSTAYAPSSRLCHLPLPPALPCTTPPLSTSL
jgi:hypothetical protein